MSDISGPPPAAAPAPAPAEVPIDPNPPSAPQPIGSQAPEKSPAEARREALERAFQRAANPPPRDAKPAPRAPRAEPGPAEAKAGHNQPPEETPQLDLKKRPSDQPRDRGRFAPRQPAEAEPAAAAPAAQPQPGVRPGEPARAPHRTLPEGTPYRDPPPRMAEHAKAVWHATPENVRGEIYRMHQEFGNAYQQYRSDHEQMNSIRPFQQMAAQHGTTLQKALGNYVSMEQLLRTDLIAGLDKIVNNMGLTDPQTGQKINVRDVAYHILNMSPDQHRLTQAQNAQSAQSHQIGQLHQVINTLAQNQQRMQFYAQHRQTLDGVNRYAETHPRLDELGDLIQAEISLGFDLDTAYRRAELLRPTRAAQTRNPSAQTRPTDKSIHGAPESPSNGAERRSGKPVGRREALQRAFNTARANGSI